MNINTLIFSLLIGLVTCQTYSISVCTCTQLLSEEDCQKNVSSLCQWDSKKQSCQIQTTTVTPIQNYARYCDSFTEIDCPKSAPCTTCGNYSACSWVEGKCTFFTSCTAFAKKSNQECQAISNRCITDGDHCVEIDECSSYKKQTSCVKNAKGNFCFWDSTNFACLESNTCENLPLTLTSDKECRELISTCTAKSGGGCTLSGNNCNDQQSELQCFWNLNKTMGCYWDGVTCKDRICNNAPINMITEESCKLFRSDGICTIKANGGCITRTTCSITIIKEACTKDILGNECFWNGVSCVDKICDNAPNTLITNSDCDKFKGGCITKSGGGCVTNGSCSAANIEVACVKNSIGVPCIWDSSCKEKTCANASILNTTNDACEAYLSGSNCITKQGGGCIQNTTCSAINIEQACIKNQFGFSCFWDNISKSCKDKTCLNAPSTNNTHELCQAFLNTCTVNSSNTGCVDKTCENSLKQAICDKDINNKPCIWKGKCYKKLCVLAPSFTNTHADCQSYHSSCTLSNTGQGCVTLPIKCEAILLERACQVTIDGQLCGWNGSSCINKSCSTASKTLTTTSQCQEYLSQCVANNPVVVDTQSIIQGCQDLPLSCASRKASQNCEIARAGSPTCLWVSSSSTCIEKSCATASINGTTNAIQEKQFSFINCQNYLSICTNTNAQGVCVTTQQPCISNNSEDGCMNKPQSCNVLVQNNCTNNSSTQGDCYWNGTSCVDRQCPNIVKTTHLDCQNIFNQCTVNNERTNCQLLQNTCTSYKIQENCKITSTNKTCIWTGIACRSATCADASDTILYDTDLECQNYLVADDTCTVILKTGGLGCVPKQVNCTNYRTQAQCHQTIQNQTGIDDCKWIIDKCYSISAFDRGLCSTFKGTQEMCQQFRQGCTNSIDASISSSCFVDCTLKTGTNLTFLDCQAVDLTCSVKADGKGCVQIQSSCSGYGQLSTNCFRSTLGLCVMNNSAPPTCQSVTQASQCVFATGLTGLNHSKCQEYNIACTSLNNGLGCQIYQQNCENYEANADSCTMTPTNKCFFNSGSCITITSKANCSTITGLNGLDHSKCQAYFNGCTSIANGTSCQELKDTCEQYPGNASECTRSLNGMCYLLTQSNSSKICITIKNPASDCGKITGLDGTITYENCQSYNTACSVNRARNACVPQLPECSNYLEISNCFHSAKGLCIISSNNFITCVAASTAQTCEAIDLGIGNYNDAVCYTIKSDCTYNGTKCAIKTCSLAQGIQFNHKNCNMWLNSCTVNSTNNGCVQMMQKCSDQSQTQCLQSMEGECIVDNSVCVKKKCDLAQINDNFNTDGKCSTFFQQCTVARTGGCQSRSNCSDYMSQLQCLYNRIGLKCFWNPTIMTCVNLNCGEIEKSSKFDTHAKCQGIDDKLQCTVRAAYGITLQGCMERGPCSIYSSQDQCHKNATGGECVWNINQNEGTCQDKACSTAPLQLVSHDDCYRYFNTATVTCTVTINDGQLGGCQQTTACMLYSNKEQCQIDFKGDPCAWVEQSSICADKQCETAPTILDDDTKCRSYLNYCTVADNGQGCTNIPESCETMTQKQCSFNKKGDPCYWTGSGCITRSCENAPDSVVSAEDCNTYLQDCTLDSIKCKVKVCEDYPLTTDILCRQQMSSCTSNGINCVTRGTCYQALSQAGCVTSSTGQLCEWITTTGYCTIKSCLTAPLTLKSDEACLQYFNNCTTKKNGGCTIKSTCSAANIEAACKTALDGTICIWDLSLNKCRDQDCQDLSGNSHAQCQSQKIGCTIGINKKCARIQNCEQTTIREACIEGINGPCLWIEKYLNTDGTTGACFRYTSCQSLSWTTDQLCKLISSQCTTNGTKCVGITLCSETNTKGGCVTGYDGSCIQTVPTLNSQDSKLCKPFNSCTEALYITHSECQTANVKCTTNGITGCIPLGECSSYSNQVSCYINDKGLVVESSGAIISKGICIWNNNNNKCRDLVCNDLTGSTHLECYSQLSKCTSNGAICILKGNCSSYTSEIDCKIAQGSDGLCFWDKPSTICRLLTCADIPNGSISDACKIISCITNGTTCIPKANCSTYTNQITCNQGGLDGICVFNSVSTTSGKCNQLTDCAQANKDQNACNAVKDRCYWQTNSTATSCVSHTCATNLIANGICTHFYNWDKKSQQICSIQNGLCQEMNPSNLSQTDCYLVSGYTYSWNQFSKKCLVCSVDNQINNTPNTTDPIKNNTDLGYLIEISIILYGYLIF